MEMPSIENIIFKMKKGKYFLFSVDAYKIQGMIYRHPNFFGEQGHLKFLQSKYLRST